MKILITGASGFTGGYLTAHIRQEVGKDNPETELFGLYRSGMPDDNNPVIPVSADICDAAAVSELIEKIRPDYVIHLAGGRFGSLESLFQVNVSGTANILEGMRDHCDESSRFLYVSSSAVYGYVGDNRIPEETPLRPVGEYGITKAAGEMAALSYSLKYGMNVSVVRPFNLLGPGQDESFVTGKIILQTREVLDGKGDALSLYSLDSRRDFIDVRDAASAYWKIISSSEFGDKCRGRIFNAGSGESTSIRHIISLLEEITGKEIRVNLPESVRPEIIPNQISDNRLISDSLGWSPLYDLKKTLSDMLEFY